MNPRPHAAREFTEHEPSIDYAADVHAGVDELTAGLAHQAPYIGHVDIPLLSPNTVPEVDWFAPVVGKTTLIREYVKRATAQASVGLNWEAFVTTLTPAAEVSGALHHLSAFWPDVGSRLREIRSALREDFGCDINSRSLKTLHEVLQQVPHVPRPRLGAGDDGTLAAIWALGRAGIFTAEFLGDGKVGCVALLDRGRPSYSETLEASPACALLSCLARLRLLLERR